MPVCEAIRQWRPTETLCAICTRLSIFVPSPMTVSRVEPRSIVVFAPISTSSWTMTRRACGIFWCPFGEGGSRTRHWPMRAPG